MKYRFWIKLQAVVLCLVMLIGITFFGTLTVSADILIDADKFEDNYYKPVSDVLGYQIDSDKDYEIVNSTLFNKAGQEIWDMTKLGKMTVLAGQSVNGHSVIKLTGESDSKGGEVYFWNEKSPALPEEKLEGRTPFGKLFPGYDTSAYTGIRIYLNKEKTGQSVTLQVLLGSMSKGYWPRSDTGFYTYEIQLPKKAYEGYVYLPFEDFVNLKGEKLNPATINFIAFKYKRSTTDVYEADIGELGLWREGRGGVTDTGKINIGLGEKLSESTEYMFYDSLLFNNSTSKEWDRAKNSGFEVTPRYTGKGYYPSDAESSVKLSTTGKSKYNEIFFWNDKLEDGSRPNGILFGTNLNITDYDGIRLWVKTGADNPYALVQIMIGSKAYYQSEAQGGYYSYNLIIDGGFEGYVNIPFENFVNLKGESVPVGNFNFIAFKHGEGAYVKSDIYFSNLQIYGLKENNTYKANNVGVQLDSIKNYELVPSLIFEDASQTMWEQTKVNGIIATARITDSEYIPQRGKTSVNIHTTGEKSSPEIYYWNEYSDGNRRTHGRFWGSTDCTEYEGIRFWLKIDENNSYSKLTVYLGQMFTGYWPKDEVGFFGYDIEIPRGGFEGYVNIPFNYFKNKKGEVLSAKNINFLALKYNETGFKETDMWISDLIMYREAVPEKAPAENSTVVGGDKLQVEHIKPDGTIVEDIGNEYQGIKTEVQKNQEDKPAKNNGKASNLNWIIIAAAVLLLLAVILVLIIILVKKRKKD